MFKYLESALKQKYPLMIGAAKIKIAMVYSYYLFQLFPRLIIINVNVHVVYIKETIRIEDGKIA